MMPDTLSTDDTGSACQKILIVADTSVGDVVLNQILYMLLKNYYPSVDIDVVAPPWADNLLRRMPQVNRHIAIAGKIESHGLLRKWMMGRSLRGQYDQAIVIPRTSRSAMIPWFAHVSTRIGYARKRRLWLINDSREYPFYIGDRMARLAPLEMTLPSSLPRPKLQIDSTEVIETSKRFELAYGEKRNIIGLVPGATSNPMKNPAKRWPIEAYAALAKMLVDEGSQVCVLGTDRERSLGEVITAVASHQIVNLCGETSLDDAINLIAGLNCLVSNDSGLMHVAAAVDTPVVGIYGSTSPNVCPPHTDKRAICSIRTLCSPCRQHSCPYQHHACMTSISPGMVHEAMRELLDGKTKKLVQDF